MKVLSAKGRGTLVPHGKGMSHFGNHFYAEYTTGMNLSLNDVELPVRLRTETPLNDEEFMRFCAANEPMRFERDANGEIIVMSPGFSEGGSTELAVGSDLIVWARADGRGKVFGANAGFTLADHSVRAADAAWIGSDRWNRLTQEQRILSFAPICPDFVIEVWSATDRLKDIREKMQIWIDNGAELAWLIDPERKAVEVYRAGENPEIYENPTSMQGAGPVRGFELVMARIWE